MFERQRAIVVLRAFIPLLFLTLAGCVAPAYDNRIDDLIGTLQSNTDTEIVTLITLDHKIAALKQKTDPDSLRALEEAKKKAGYDANTDYYDKVDVALTTLSLRVDALPDKSTGEFKKSLGKLHGLLLGEEGSLQRVHEKAGILSEVYLRDERKLLNVEFGALLLLQTTLKNGQSK